MPKVSKDGQDQSHNNDPAGAVQSVPQVALTTKPVFIAGVNRKINLGNFENLDIYSGLALPVEDIPEDCTEEQLREILHDAAALAFAIVSKETGDRFQSIKESQNTQQQ